jgi:nucleotide-binding universal stress UspA family protein
VRDAYDTIVVGTDGSADSARAVEWTAGLAATLGAQVIVVHAVPLLDHLPGQPLVIASEVRAELQELLESTWTDSLDRHGVDYHCVMEDGPPLLAIPRVAERVAADLIVVASHGAGNSAALLVGSTSHGLIQTSVIPVVVIPTQR